jgi:hypothetical protein
MILYAYHFYPMCTTSHTHIIFPQFITSIIASKEHNSGNSSLHYFHHYTDTSALLGPNISLSNPFSNAHCQCLYFPVMGQNSQPYTTDNTTLLYISIIVIFDNYRCLMCAPRVIRHTSIRYSSSCHTRINMGASIFFTAAMTHVFGSARSCGNGETYVRTSHHCHVQQ